MLTLSHSAMDLWGQCALRFKLTKLDRVPQAPAEALICGTAVHAAIECDGRAWMARGGHVDGETLREVAAVALRARWERDDPRGLLTAAWGAMYDRTLALVDAYVAAVQPHYRPTAVEEAFGLSVPDADGLVFTGRIDAMQDGADGPVILDFKTASKPWEPHAEDSKDQASAYLMATAAVGARQVTFVVLSPAGVSFRPTRRTARQLDAYEAKVRATALAIGAATASGEFPARTGPLCRFCSVQGHCAEGSEWVRRDGRGPAVPVLGEEVAG